VLFKVRGGEKLHGRGPLQISIQLGCTSRKIARAVTRWRP
jgi:hypothetical protein